MQTDGSPSTDRPSLASEASSSSPSPSRDDGAPRIIVATLAGELHCFELHVSATKAARSLRCWSSRLPMDSPLLTCVGEPSGPTLLTSPKHATTASSVGSSTSTSRADVASLQTHANSRVVADVPVCFFCAAAAASAMRAESPTNNMSIHINNSSLASSTEARMAPAPGDWPFSSKHWLAITHPHSSSSDGGEVDGAQWFWRSSLHHSPMVLPHRNNNNNNNNDGSSEGTWVPLEEMVQRWNQSCCNTHRVVILRKLSEVYAEYSLATGELVFTPEEAEEGLMFVGEDGNKAEPPPHHRSSIVGKRASPDVHERNGGYLALTLTSHIVRVLQPAAMHARKSAAPKYSSKLVEGTIAMELIAPDDEDDGEGIDGNIPVNADGLRSPTSCSVAQEEEDEEEDEDSGSEVDYEAFCRRRSAMLEKQEKARQRAEASAHHRDPNAEVSPSPSSSPPPSHMTCTVDGVVHLHHYDCVSEEWKQSIHYLNVGCVLAAYSLFPSSSSSCAPMAAGTRQPQPIMKAMQVMPTSTNLRSSVEYVLPSSVDANHKKSNQQQQQSVPLVELPTETRRGYLTSSANGLFVLVAEDVSAHADVLSPIASRSSRHLFPSLPQTSLRETSSADVARNGSVAVQSATGWRRSSSAPTPGSDGTSFFDANFHPVAILGKGGSGVALLAKHRLTDVLYAVKVVLARDVESEEEIVKEVRLHAYLEHPHLVRYHACWSETVTPARAHQLALIGLCRKSEVVDDLGRSGHYTHRTHPRSPATTNNNNNNHHTRFSPGTLTCTTSTPSSAVGWGQIDLTRDTNGMLLVGEDSFSSISRSMSEASPISSHRGLFPGASHLFENSESSDDDDDDDDSSTSDDDDGSDDESESPSSLDQRRRRTRSVVGSTVIFLQMEFCQTTLAMYLATRKKIDPIMNCIILQQLLLGLSYLHQRNVLHRDIKPSNVFLDFRCQVHANPSSSFMPGELGDHEDGVSPSAEPYFMGSEADGSRRRGSKSMSSTALTAPLMPKKPSAFTEERPTFSIEAQQTSDELLNRHFEQMLCASQLLRSMVSNRVSLLSPEARDAHSPLMAHRKSSASASKELKTLVAWLHQHLVQLRLGDFGLAKLFHDQKLSVSGVVSHTRANTVGAGSPLYASPEQMRGDVCTPASDLFSVGVMMAEMYIQPTTVSERLVVLREVREGRFPDADLLAQFPELAVVEALTHSDPHARMSLTKVRDALHGHLVMYLEKYFLQV